MSEARALYAPEWLTYPKHPEALSPHHLDGFLHPQ